MSMKSPQSQITEIRQNIDLIHFEILELLLKRNDLAEDIWKIKKQNDFSFIDENREKEIFEKILADSKVNQNKNLQLMIKNIFENILIENKKYLAAQLKVQNEIK